MPIANISKVMDIPRSQKDSSCERVDWGITPLIHILATERLKNEN